MTVAPSQTEFYNVINIETRRAMGVSTGPELASYTPPPDAKLRLLKWVQSYLSELDYLMTDEETAVCVAADIARMCELRGEPEEPADSWERDRASWAAAACKYHATRGNKVSRVEYTPAELARLRALLDDSVTLERAAAEINAHRKRQRARRSTIEALMLSLRERGPKALAEPATRARLRQLSAAQIDEVGDRLQRLPRRPWTPAEIKQLLKTPRGC